MGVRIVFISLLSLSISGCVSSQSVATYQDFDGLGIYSNDGERGLVFVKHTQGPGKYCFATPPDAIATSSSGFSLSMPMASGDEKVGEQNSNGVTAFGGRSASVLLAREFLYRACEFTANYDLDKTEAESFYLKIINSLTGILPSQIEPGTEALSSDASDEGQEDN